jgi:hypothetical protein
MKDFCVFIQKFLESIAFSSFCANLYKTFQNEICMTQTLEPQMSDPLEVRFPMEHQHKVCCTSHQPRALESSRTALSMRVVGIGIGPAQSVWGLSMPELDFTACRLVAGDPIVAELTALEFGLLNLVEDRNVHIIIESASPRVLDLLRSQSRGEPTLARALRNHLGVFAHLHLVGFDDLADVRNNCQNVLRSLAISGD